MYDCWTPFTLWTGDDKLNVNLRPLIKEQLELMEQCSSILKGTEREMESNSLIERQNKISEDYKASSRNKSYLMPEIFDDLLKRQREIAEAQLELMKNKSPSKTVVFSEKLIKAQEKLEDKSLGKFTLPSNFTLYICEAAHQVQDEIVGKDGLGGRAEFDSATEEWLKNFQSPEARSRITL
jgi:hypothetical protein